MPPSRRAMFFALSVICVLYLAGCGSQAPAAIPTAPPSPTPAAIAPATATNQPGPPAPTHAPEPTPGERIAPRTHYTLTAVLDYDLHHLQVDEQIAYTNHTGEALNELLLMVDALYYPGVFTLKSLTWQDGTPVQNMTVETGRLRLPLVTSLSPGDSLEIGVSFDLHLPSPTASADVRPIPFGYTARQTNMVDWYPFIPPYRAGEGWLAHQAGYFGEHLVYEISDYNVNISLANSRPDLTIAASTPARIEDGWHHYEHEAARNFVFSVSPEYEVATTTVGDVTIMSYTFPVHRAAGQAVLDATAKSLAIYNDLFGPYPRRLLSVVEADFLDGMEYDGLYFLSNGFYNLYQGTPGEYLVAIAVHETAHQWFYAQVGNDQALQPWLDEALCTYSERLFFERAYPDALSWWWEYRIKYYAPQGPVDGSIYNPSGYRAYRDAVYLNGALFLEDLRSLTGDPAFFAFIQDYLLSQSGKIATTDSFFSLLREHAQVDLAPLLSKYFSNP